MNMEAELHAIYIPPKKGHINFLFFLEVEKIFSGFMVFLSWGLAGTHKKVTALISRDLDATRIGISLFLPGKCGICGI